MYKDTDKLLQFKPAWLTERCHFLLSEEKNRLFLEDKRKLSLMKLVNNLILEKYGEGDELE